MLSISCSDPNEPKRPQKSVVNKNSNERWKTENQRVLHGKGDPRKYLKRNKWQIERKINKRPNQKKNKYKQR
jgi:hypothetical protein